MKSKPERIGRGLAVLFAFCVLICGCDNSGYGQAEPYVISGTVSTGVRVTGTVHVISNKRADRYEADIDPVDGTYSVSVTPHDPPYLVWADLDGEGTLYSYCAGRRNPSDEIIAAAVDAAREHELIMSQTTNITPLTDLIIGLAYLEDPQARFEANPEAGFPSASEISTFQGYLEDDILVDTFVYLAETLEDPSLEFFDLFHGNWVADGPVDQLLTVLVVRYTETADPVSRTAELILEGGVPGNESVFYSYDLTADDELAKMQADEALQIFQIRLGF